MTRDLDNPFGPLARGRVLAHEVRIGPDGQPVTDVNGNPIPTGLLRIQLLDRNEVREGVPYCSPVAGNSAFIGSLPEIGTTCVVGWEAQNKPIVLGFLGFGIGNVTQGRQTLPTMEPGEVVLQSSKTAPSKSGKPGVWSGPRTWLDRYGRYRVEAEGYELLVGYELADEFGSEPQKVDDPVLGQPVFYRQRILTNEKRVCDDGSEIEEVALDRHVHTGRDYVMAVGGKLVVSVGESLSISDTRQNGLFVADGGVDVRAKARARLVSGGAVELRSGGDTAFQAVGAIRAVAGEDFSLLATRSIDLKALVSVVLKALGEVSLTAGLKASLTAAQIELLAATVAIGPSPVQQHAVLGELLVAYLTQLTAAVAALSGVVTGVVGGSGAASLAGPLAALAGQVAALTSKTVTVSP